MNICVMRHGQTDWNNIHKIQGQTDIKLNNVGINQAKETKSIFNTYDFDLIICSPLQRTIETANIINEDKNIEIIYENALLERYLGDFQGLDADFEPEEIYNYNLNLKDKNVEPVVDLCDRVYKLLDYIKENLNNRKILLVTHGGTARAIEAYFYGIKDNGNLPPEDLKNCEIREYTYNENK